MIHSDITSFPWWLAFLFVVRFQDDISRGLELFLETIRCQFPRLFFVDDAAILDMIAQSQHPPMLFRQVLQCFPGLEGLKFDTVAQSLHLTAAMAYHGKEFGIRGKETCFVFKFHQIGLVMSNNYHLVCSRPSLWWLCFCVGRGDTIVWCLLDMR